ncbi:hypothetical protein OG747_02980 [Streptomyces sp. NBC_01384]|uniref:hypothetical protein n=1 Tax=Streptomyces sp. NBC_01384 TaxID=2903847 RepID=UPI0032509AFA
MDSVTATVSIRQQRGALVEDRDWGTAPVDLLQSACPWRTFRRYKGQKHWAVCIVKLQVTDLVCVGFGMLVLVAGG